MKFNAREDIEAPMAEVYAVLSDHATFERAAMRRGADVTPMADGDRPGWKVAFTFRVKRRQIEVRLDRAEPPSAMEFSGQGRHVDGKMQIELMELGPRHTRMIVSTEVFPRTLTARLFLQSLRLAKGRVTGRYKKRIAQFAALLEARCKGEPAGL